MPIDVTRIKAICFDIDGTLSETDDLYVAKLARFIQLFRSVFHGFDPQKAARRIIMGIESPGNWLYSIPDRIGLDDDIAVIMNKISHRIHHKSEFILGENVADLVKMVSRTFPLAIVSVRGERATNDFLESSGLGNYFSLIVNGNTCEHTKPYPDPLIFTADRFRLSPNQLLMVGDTTVDMECAKRAGCQSVGVLSGFGEEKELRRSGADLIINRTIDLASILKINLAP